MKYIKLFGLTKCSLRMFLGHIFSGSDIFFRVHFIISEIYSLRPQNVESGNPENQMHPMHPEVFQDKCNINLGFFFV